MAEQVVEVGECRGKEAAAALFEAKVNYKASRPKPGSGPHPGGGETDKYCRYQFEWNTDSGYGFTEKPFHYEDVGFVVGLDYYGVRHQAYYVAKK